MTEKGAISYARVSSEGQVDGYSLSAQLRECRSCAERLEVPILKEFTEEGVSGAKEHRPALAEALAYCAKHKDKIAYFIVKDVDRLARDTLVYLIIKTKLNELGVQLHSINQPSIGENNPHARFMEGIFSSVAQLEREQILARTTSGSRDALDGGAWISPPSYGYATDKTVDGIATLKSIPERAEAVLRAFQMCAEGKDQREICDTLNTLGYRTSKGGEFSKQTMSYMLRNIVYTGRIRNAIFPDRIIEGKHPAIVSIELWETVQEQLSGNRGRGPTMKMNPNFPLSSILKCHKCGGPMSGSLCRGKSGKKYPYYHCRKSGCKAKNILRDKIEKEFLIVLKRIHPTETGVSRIENGFIKVLREKWAQKLKDKAVLQRRLTELDQQRDKVEGMFIDNKISEDTYKRQLSKVEGEIITVSKEKDENLLSETQLKEQLLFARRFLLSISNTWENGTVQRRRLIQRLVFPVGLRCLEDSTLGTLEIPRLLALAGDSKIDESSMVDRAGLEPATNCLRGNCSTD
jgi:site-specific DNA recombinase